MLHISLVIAMAAETAAAAKYFFPPTLKVFPLCTCVEVVADGLWVGPFHHQVTSCRLAAVMSSILQGRARKAFVSACAFFSHRVQDISNHQIWEREKKSISHAERV